MSDHLPGEDPGWGISARTFLGMLVPGLGVKRAAAAQNVLVALRNLYVSFAVALVVVGLVGVLVSSGEGPRDLDPAVATSGAFGLGLIGVLASQRMVRALPCDDVGQLLGAYRTRFFLRIAFADMSVLLGFVGAMLSQSSWPLVGGAVPAVLGFALLAPTRANLEREDEALRGRGCPHSLYGGLLAANTE